MESMKEELNKIISTYPCLSDLLENNPNRVYYPSDDIKIKGLSLFWKILYYAPTYPILFEFLYNNIQNFTKDEINEELETIGTPTPLIMCLVYSKTKYNQKIIRTLLENGADVNKVVGKNGCIRLVLENAHNDADLWVILLLVEYGCDVNAIEENGQTLLYNLTQLSWIYMDIKIVKIIHFLISKNALLYVNKFESSFVSFEYGENTVCFVLQNMQDCDKNIKFCTFLKEIFQNFDDGLVQYKEFFKTIKNKYTEIETPCLFISVKFSNFDIIISNNMHAVQNCQNNSGLGFYQKIKGLFN
jgi:hypothetical protein